MSKMDHIGDVAPALLLQLAAGEKSLVLLDSVKYRDPTVKVDRIRRTFPNPTGQWPTQLGRYFETLEGPGSATISTGTVGEVRPQSLGAGESIFLHHASLLAHDAQMGFGLVVLAVYQVPGMQQPSYLEAVQLTGPGNYAFQTLGNALTFQLKPGETIRTVPHALLGLSPGVGVRVNIFGGAPNFPTNHYFPLLDVVGPGTVMVHSGEFFMEGPRE
ncbi:MAG: AIM24 family protein [Thermoplasmata archaeon]|nr:AIM24 family protein [Thermoplasmata archaeon]